MFNLFGYNILARLMKFMLALMVVVVVWKKEGRKRKLGRRVSLIFYFSCFDSNQQKSDLGEKETFIKL